MKQVGLWAGVLEKELGAAYRMMDLPSIVQKACANQGEENWRRVYDEFVNSGFTTLPLTLRNELSLYDGTAHR
jgi:hypothetical protein